MYSCNPYYEKYLAHYGVPGMKWGVRKSKNRKNKKVNLKDKIKSFIKKFTLLPKVDDRFRKYAVQNQNINLANQISQQHLKMHMDAVEQHILATNMANDLWSQQVSTINRINDINNYMMF